MTMHAWQLLLQGVQKVDVMFDEKLPENKEIKYLLDNDKIKYIKKLEGNICFLRNYRGNKLLSLTIRLIRK